MKIQVLDHGYVELIEAWGQGKNGHDHWVERDSSGEPYVHTENDYEVGIIEAARQSTSGSFRGWEGADCNCGMHGKEGMGAQASLHAETCPFFKNPGDRRLLSYLFHNNHSTPFEFAGMVIEVRAPIFVFREWHRHRTQAYNEMSARYAPLPDLNYVPSVKRITHGGGHLTKQAGAVAGVEPITEERAEWMRVSLQYNYERLESIYQDYLESGAPKELARLVLPVGRYSQMRASTSLRNWLQFLSLRADPHAQWEIQQYACAVGQIIKAKFPQTYAQLPPSRRLLIEEGLGE